MKHILAALLVPFVPAQAPAASFEAVDIVILGEVHDNADAHLGQADVIRSLSPTAVVFEMLSPEDAERANADSSAIREIWEGGRWPAYEIYEPIFQAIGSAQIIGAASSKSTLSVVFRDGPADEFGAEATRYGLSKPLPQKQQEAREILQFEAHCEAMPREMMSGMVNVQRFRDARFAQAALSALDNYGPPVAVVTGNGHARNDWGVPAALAQAAPQVSFRSIAFVEAPPSAPYDEIRTVPPASRPDPCEPLRQRPAD